MRSAVIFLVVGILAAGAAHAANEGGSGGGAFASHFAGVGKRTGQSLKLACGDADAPKEVCAVLPAYLEAVTLADVLPRDQVFGPDGQPRDAINDGKGTIQLDVNRWQALAAHSNGPELQVRLAVHEYLGIAKVEKSDSYPVSDSIIALLRQDNFSFVQIVGNAPILPRPPQTFSRNATFVNYHGCSPGTGYFNFCEAKCNTIANNLALASCYTAGFNTCVVITAGFTSVGNYADGIACNSVVRGTP